MTRFARAHGSKASNERQPEEATSWSVMQQQLHETQNTSNLSQKNAIKDIRKQLTKPTAENSKTEWADFEMNLEESVKVAKKRKKSRTVTESNVTKADDVLQTSLEESAQLLAKETSELAMLEVESVGQKQDKKAKKRKSKTATSTEEPDNLMQGDKEGKRGKNKTKKLKMNTTQETENEADFENAEAGDVAEGSGAINVNSPKKKKKPKKKKNKQNTSSTGEEHSNPDKAYLDRHGTSGEGAYKRRKPDVGTVHVLINGQDVEAVKFMGFYVLKEDADRLHELQRSLLEKKVPRFELQKVLQLERRKAEKALSRLRKKVCYHCRKAGHVLSECPELHDPSGGSTAPLGICFKCGSTEHTHYECKVNRGQDFRHAKCFVCNEQGHIAKQCPDNPRGLYPNGGACRICGDVTHLKKDCPDLIQEKEEQNITLDTFNGKSLEALDEDLKKMESVETKRSVKKAKKITF